MSFTGRKRSYRSSICAVYDRKWTNTARIRTVRRRKPGRCFTTVFSPYFCRKYIVYQSYQTVFPSKNGRKSSTRFTARILRITAVQSPYFSSWAMNEFANGG